MADLLFVAVLIGFFLLLALFVAACDRIIRSDEEAWAQGSLGTRCHRVVFRLGYFLNRLDGSPK